MLPQAANFYAEISCCFKGLGYLGKLIFKGMEAGKITLSVCVLNFTFEKIGLGTPMYNTVSDTRLKNIVAGCNSYLAQIFMNSKNFMMLKYNELFCSFCSAFH